MKILKAIVLVMAISISNIACAYDFICNGLAYKTTSSTTCKLTYDTTILINGVSKPASTYSGYITIPSTVMHGGDTYSVTSIGDYAFGYCSGLLSVNIPYTVTSIGENAFYLCSNLTSVVIPNSVTEIARQAFYNCSSLCTVTIPNSVTTIGFAAFHSCIGLQSITIPNSITSIANSTFSNCRGLSSVVIPNTVTAIGESAFSSCVNLRSVNLPNSVTSIGKYAFYACSNLVSITIPNSVSSIQNGSFGHCNNLISVTIGNSVSSIGHYAFSNCISIDTLIMLPQNPPSLESTTFDECPMYRYIKVFVPCGSMGIYQNANRWNMFYNISEVPLSFSATSSNVSQGYVSVLTMPTCQNRMATVEATPYNGYEFDHWSDGSTSNPYNLYVSTDMTLVGYFKRKQGQTCVEDAEQPDLMAYGKNGTVFIKGNLDQPVFVYNIKGQCVYKGTLRGDTTIEVPCKGIYIVRFNNGILKKVFVD